DTLVLHSFPTRRSSHLLVVSFYTAGYKDLATRYPHAKLRTLSTDRQKSYKRVQDMVVGELHKYLSNPQESSFRYHYFPNEIKSRSEEHTSELQSRENLV